MTIDLTPTEIRLALIAVTYYRTKGSTNGDFHDLEYKLAQLLEALDEAEEP